MLAASDLDLPVSLALFDFVPVAMSGLAVALIARHVAATRPDRVMQARLGAALVVSGGLAKATWKLLEATETADLPWLAELLFLLLAPGFVLLAASLTRFRISVGGVAGAVVVLGVLGATGDRWSAAVHGVLLLTTIVASTVLVVVLARAASADDQRAEARLMWGALALMFCLGPLAAIAEQSVAAQWAEEAINSVAQGLLALALWRWSLSRSPVEPMAEASQPVG